MTRAQLPAIAVLCSGQGSNLQAIIDATRSGVLRARVALVISDKKEAFALKRAARHKIPAHFVDPKTFPSREAFERAMIALIRPHAVRAVCLAGFMRILTPVFVREYSGRILNIHPALLPAFPGAHAVRDAFGWGVKVMGVTVHFVDEQVDHGPIILQEAVQVMPSDTQERVFSRIHRVEHRLYPRAIKLFLSGKILLEGRLARVKR